MKIEYYLPSTILSNESLEQEFPTWDSAGFEKKVGIRNRHIVSEDETALDLAIGAAEKCLQGFDKSKIDYLILCTQSPEYQLPTTACILQARLGLSNDCAAFDYNLGCSGYIYGLSIVKGLLAGNIANNVLLVMSETYSKNIHNQDRTNRSIFGDGAAATLITKEDLPLLGDFVLRTDGRGFDKLIISNGGQRNDFDEKAELKNYGDNNFYTDNHLYMNGPDIFSFTIENVPELVEDTLLKNNLEKDDIDYFVFHQANAFMLNFLRKMIKIPKEKFCIDLADTGNTVSATIPIALKKCD